jgi:hypothetical protein
MGWLDIVVFSLCHDIIGTIAVQHKQFNFARQGTKVSAFTLAFFMAWPVLAGSIVQPSKPDPLLDAGPPAPCAAGVDYAAGIDANGNSLAPADVAAGPVPLPDTIAIPIARNGVRTGQTSDQGRGRRQQGNPTNNPISPDNASNRDSAYVALDGRKLEPLLNPPPCGAVH